MMRSGLAPGHLMPCPHCGAETAAIGDRCSSCQTLLTPAFDAGLTAISPPPPQDETRAGAIPNALAKYSVLETRGIVVFNRSYSIYSWNRRTRFQPTAFDYSFARQLGHF